MRRGLRVRPTGAERAVDAGSDPSSIRTADAPRPALARLGRSGDPVVLTDSWQQGSDDPDHDGGERL